MAVPAGSGAGGLALTSLARDAMRQWPALTLVLALVVGFEWLSERRLMRFEASVDLRDKAVKELLQETFRHLSHNTAALRNLADRLHADGWDDSDSPAVKRGG